VAQPSSTRRRWVRRGLIAAVVVVILAVAGPFVFIHFIEGPPPAKLSLPTATTSTSIAAKTTNGTTGSSASTSSHALSGTWNVTSGSVVGYRVSEVLVGQSTTAVGRTTKVWGSADVKGSMVTSGKFSVDMATVKSDQSQRNAQFDGRIMDVAKYPTATLTLTSPIDLAPIPQVGVIVDYKATGSLSMHGVAKSISFAIAFERTSSDLDILAEIPIKFSTWDIVNPSEGGFVTTANNGTLEVLLHLTQGIGNPVSTAGASTSGPGGTQITVPSTTVPPLNITSNK